MRAGLLLLLVAGFAAGCTPVFVDGRSISGITWVAVSVDGRPPIEGAEPTIEFEDGRFHGSAGCNGFASQDRLAIIDGRVELPSISFTGGNCIDLEAGTESPVMEVERRFASALSAAERFSLRGEHLVISGPRGEIIFEARR